MAILIIAGYSLRAQVAINTDGSSASGTAMLDVKSTTKGFLPPRMTQAQRNAIGSPVAGLTVWCTDCGDYGEMQVYNGTEWTNMIGEEAAVVWLCGDTLVDTRDGQSYATVQIGTQCWMAENLNIGTMINGNSNQTNNSIIEKYCFSNNTSNCDTYGGLYQWNEMMQYVTTEGIQGICRDGWHLPTDAEWMTLEEEVESTTGVNWNTTLWRGTDAGGNLKEAGTTHWASPNTGATNSSGFTALPGGYRNTSYYFGYLTNYAYLWSSSEDGSKAWLRTLVYNSAQVNRSYTTKAMAFSVRCLRD